tara:strand:+ start:12942 stop:13277 length:336 start_codon:yes stop_codon:yes gene_type:complete
MPHTHTVDLRVLLVVILAGSLSVISCSSYPSWEESMSKPENKSKFSDPTIRFDPKLLKEKLDQGEEVFLLDVRRPEELEQIGTIEGYHHIPMNQLEDRISEVPKGKPLVVF